MSKSFSPLFQLSLCTLGCLYATSDISLAQVTSDGTVNTQVNQNGNVAEITGGETRGSNLFHSFQDFSVSTGNEAFFDNANDISNIFSRVTGGNISNIDGAIRANGSASLFLINPAGIIFGQGARLDIGGSFYGSTASSILFDDGEFSAVDNLEQPILTVNAPIGLGFRDSPAPIEVNSIASADFDSMPSFDDNLFGLRVPDSETFALAGGNITANSGGIVSIGGQITLGAVGEAGTLELNFDNDSPIFEFSEDLLRANVSLTNNAEFLVSGSGGGDLAITARNIEILQGSGLFAGIFSGLGSPDSQAGNINLQASESVMVDGITEDGDFSGVFNEVSSESIGNAGTLSIITTNLSVSNGAQVSSSTNAEGNGGTISINTGGSVSVDGTSDNENAFTGIFSQVNSTGIGNSGQLSISTGNLSVTNGAQVSASTFGLGDGGAILINASESVVLEEGGNNNFTSIYSNVGSDGIGNSGGVNIVAELLEVNRGGQIQSVVFGGEGNSGKIMIDSNSISLDGRNSDDSPSGAFSLVTEEGVGNAGGLEIIANSFSMTNRAQILSNTAGMGNAGNVDILVEDEVNLVNSSILAEVTEGTGMGEGGDINITTSSLLLLDGSALLADAENIGDAGDININASENVILSGEGISAFPGATNLVPSQISATVESEATGDGGDVNITTSSLTVQDNGFISATTFGNGNAGNLTISTQKLRLEGGAELDAITFGDGNAGNLTIRNAETIEILGTAPDGSSPSGLFASAIEGSGDGGNLSISTNELTIQDRAAISVGNFQIVFGDRTPRTPGSGTAGSMNIKANSLNLSNQARIDATTQSEAGNSANINLQIADRITLRDDSFISAQAFGNANGGNLTIATDFIIAFPEGNNDIIASAEQGRGGNITIDAESLLGIEERPLNPFTNDINASSQVRGLDGTVNITTPDINPIQGAIELPTNVVEPEQTAQQVCQANREATAQDGLIISGKGGIVPEPGMPLNSLNVTVNGEVNPTANVPEPIETAQGKIQPARGVKVTETGEIILTAYRTDNSGERLPEIKLNCG